MQALIGDFGQPLPRLTIDVVQIGELAQRPEVLAKIPYGALDFSFGSRRQLHPVVAMRGHISG
jgi:hypothetical protein